MSQDNPQDVMAAIQQALAAKGIDINQLMSQFGAAPAAPVAQSGPSSQDIAIGVAQAKRMIFGKAQQLTGYANGPDVDAQVNAIMAALEDQFVTGKPNGVALPVSMQPFLGPLIAEWKAATGQNKTAAPAIEDATPEGGFNLLDIMGQAAKNPELAPLIKALGAGMRGGQPVPADEPKYEPWTTGQVVTAPVATAPVAPVTIAAGAPEALGDDAAECHDCQCAPAAVVEGNDNATLVHDIKGQLSPLTTLLAMAKAGSLTNPKFATIIEEQLAKAEASIADVLAKLDQIQ